MSDRDARREALNHAIQLQLAAASKGITYDVVGRAKEFAEFLDPTPAETMTVSSGRLFADQLRGADRWQVKHRGTTNAWEDRLQRTYEVVLQRHSPMEPWLTTRYLAPCMADAIQQAEMAHPGYIARSAQDVS